MSVVGKVVAGPDVARALPWVVRAKRKLRQTRDLRALVAEHDRSSKPGGQVRSLRHFRRGVDGALRIVGPREAHCVPRALALFALVTRAGYRAVFVSGVRKVGDDVRGHAWVLVDDRPVEDAANRETLAVYREQFRIASGNALAGGAGN